MEVFAHEVTQTGEMVQLMREMMKPGGIADVWMRPYREGPGAVFFQFHWILELVTWILLIALLVAAIRWLWKKGNR